MIKELMHDPIFLAVKSELAEGRAIWKSQMKLINLLSTEF